MKNVTSAELSDNLNSLLDEVLNTGIPLEIDCQGKRLRIAPVETVDKFQKLIARPDIIVGDPDELVQMKWGQEFNFDLPR